MTRSGPAWLVPVVTLIGAAGCNRPTTADAPAASPFGTRIPYGTSELYFTDGVDPAAARAAGAVLVREKYLGGEARAAVQLRYADRRYEARFAVRPGAEAVTTADRDWRRHAELLSKECFRSAPVDVHLCDEKLATRRVIRFQPLRPDLPVRVTLRPSIGGGSQVARYHNDSDRHLPLVVALACPTTGKAAAVTLTVAPRQVAEHGWAEGWAYMSGDTIAVSHADYETAELVVP